MLNHYLLSAAVLAASVSTTTLAQVAPSPDMDGVAPASTIAKNQFAQLNPESSITIRDGRITHVWGKAFSNGATEMESAERFIAQYSTMFGVPTNQLTPRAPWGAGETILPLVWDENTNDYRFFAIGYSQEVAGIPVFRSHARFLVRNELSFPLVLASTDLHDLGAFPETLSTGAPSIASFDERTWSAGIYKMVGADAQLSNRELVIWAGYDELQVSPRLAISVIATTGDTNAGHEHYTRVLYLVDAATGAVLFEENQICNADLVGTIRGKATEGWGADECGNEVSAALGHSGVVFNGTTYYANADGGFVIPNGTGGTVSSTIGGRWFTVNDNAGSLSVVTGTDLGLPLGLVHNNANTSEFVRSQVNSYRHANIVRDFTLLHSPSFPTIGTQQGFTINVQVSGSCNAFYNGSSINFYAAGGGCNNTSFS
ncbi:MAG: hypothetical protein O2800_07785, partial [Planctomycetota bacterium]|nr:hypothetical protein [Planctomycetota bacterium]